MNVLDFKVLELDSACLIIYDYIEKFLTQLFHIPSQ